MSASQTTLSACVLAAFAMIPAAPAQPLTQGVLATRWVELQGSARVRLVAGPTATKRSSTIIAGVEITLAEGWKTYWRMPGEAGVPPVFNWSRSSNVAGVKVLYPAPQRLSEPSVETIGYKNAVVFPIEVSAKDAKKPIDLKLELEFGVCREICIPATASLALTIPLAAGTGNPPPTIAAALDRVPRPTGSRRDTDPQLLHVTAILDGTAPHLLIEARFPGGGQGADVFVEAPDGIFVPLPHRLPGKDGIARFAVDLARAGNAPELRGKALTLTLVSEAGASEATWKVE